MPGSGIWRRFVVALAVAGGTAALAAQPAPEKVTTLSLQTAQGVAGKLATTEATAGTTPEKYSVQDLDLMQPVAVRIEAVDPARPVTLKAVKAEWDKVYSECTTDAKGACEVRLRTQGNFGLLVSARDPRGAPYRLAVWAGEEIKNVPANLMTPAAGARQGWTRTEMLLGVIAAVLILGVVLVAARVMRRGGKSS
jgi:hypothetical protein